MPNSTCCRYLPEAAKKKVTVNPAVAEMYTGTWTRRKTTGESLGAPQTVLVKPVGFLSEREVCNYSGTPLIAMQIEQNKCPYYIVGVLIFGG